MRFGDLDGLTGLPIERVRHRFRHEEVITVLPVSEDIAGRDSLLVAIPDKLAVVTGDADPDSHHWMTRWAPWDTVRLADEGETTPHPEQKGYGLTVYVGGLTFHARLMGPIAQRSLRDFVVAVQARRAALVPPS